MLRLWNTTMSREHYRLLYRLEGRDRYLLYFTDGEDGVLTDSNREVVSFENEATLNAYARKASISLQPGASILLDFDKVKRWAANPTSAGLNAGEFLSVWNLLIDVARCLEDVGASFMKDDEQLSALNNRLFWASNPPALTPGERRFEPEWSATEMTALAEHFQKGIDLFSRHVTSAPASA